jgi:hypothetical protein
VSSGQSIAIDDVRRDPRFAQDVAESTGYIPDSILAAPVETRSDTMGLLEVLDRSLAPDRDDIGLNTSLAAVAAGWSPHSRARMRALMAKSAAPPLRGPDQSSAHSRSGDFHRRRHALASLPRSRKVAGCAMM